MKILIYFNLFVFAYSLVPLWNFENSTIDLLTSDNAEYTVLESSMYSLKSILKKKITRSNGEIQHENYLTVYEYIDNDGHINPNPIFGEKKVDFENIESFYKLGSSKIICPKGKYNPLYINVNNLEEKTFTNWTNNDDWDLKCYYHRKGYFLAYYLINGNNEVQAYKEGDTSWHIYDSIQICDEIYDFKLINKKENSQPNEDNGPYPFMAVIKDNNYIKLFGSKYKFDDNGISLDSTGDTVDLIEAKSNTKAYFHIGENTDFYYFTYNNASDFSSGCSSNPPGDDYAVTDSVSKQKK